MSASQINQSGAFDSGNVTVNDGSNYVAAVQVDVSGRDGFSVIDLLAGNGNITALKLTRAASPGGAHQDWITDFTTATTEMPYNNIGSSSPPIAANTRVQIKIDLSGAAEIGISAKGTTTTLRSIASFDR